MAGIELPWYVILSQRTGLYIYKLERKGGFPLIAEITRRQFFQ